MATWPLPTVKPSSTFSYAPVDQTIRTEMDVGTARVRRRTSARNDLFTTMWIMSNSQVATFRSWFDSDIDGGASWFTISLPIGNTVATSVSARFKGPYTLDHVGGTFWKINGVLEIR